MVGAGKIIRVGGFNLSTLSSSTLGVQQGGFDTLMKPLFSNGEQGFAYDPSDLSTLYQDAGGSIPVTAAGQPVGLMLDKSKGLALGAENVNPTAFVPANTTQTTVNNELSLAVTGTVPSSNQAVPTKIGATYLFTCKARADSSNTTPNAARIRVFGTNSLVSVVGSGSTQTLKLIHTATAAYTTFQLQVASANAFGQIDEKAYFSEMSVKELTGNHAYQSVSAMRPILLQKPILGNELVVNGDFSDGINGWSSASATTTVENGRAKVTYTSGGGLFQDIPVTEGKTYKVSKKVESISGNAAILYVYGTAGFSPIIGSSPPATPSLYATAVTSSIRVYLNKAGAGEAYWDDISVKEVAGYRTNQDYIEYDGVDDKLLTNLPAPLVNATVLRAIPNVGTQVKYNQTLPVLYEDSINHAGLIAINRALTRSEQLKLMTELDKKAGATSFDTTTFKMFDPTQQGFYYDPNDLSTMFQDVAGTIPVAATGQPVGLVLDKSKGLMLGAELVINGDFSNSLDGWTHAGVTQLVSDGQLEVTATTAPNASNQIIPTVIGKTYLFTCDAKAGTTNTTANSARMRIAGSSIYRAAVTANGTKQKLQIVYTATATTTVLELQVASHNAFGVVGEKAYFDNISVKELTGNHAYQTVSASRPILGRHPTSGLRNLVQFNNNPMESSWSANGFTKTGSKLDSRGTYTAVEFKGMPTGVTTVGARASATDFFTFTVCLKAGSLTTATVFLRNNTTAEGLASCSVDLLTGSVTATYGGSPTIKSKSNGFWEVTITSNKAVTIGDSLTGYYAITSTIGYDENTSFTADYCQIEQGKSATNIQVTTTPFDTTEVGFDNTYYLYFDGVDDFLQTNNIDFTTTDKMSLFTGVARLASAVSSIYELGNTTSASNGSFHLRTAISTYEFASKGAVRTVILSNAYPVPTTGVVTAVGDISNKVTAIRVNGTPTKINTGDQGASTYGNTSLYIGRRNGTSDPFNGHLYSLIGIGRLTSDSETAALEKAIAKNTGVTLNV